MSAVAESSSASAAPTDTETECEGVPAGAAWSSARMILIVRSHPPRNSRHDATPPSSELEASSFAPKRSRARAAANGSSRLNSTYATPLSATYRTSRTTPNAKKSDSSSEAAHPRPHTTKRRAGGAPGSEGTAPEDIVPA